MKGVGRKAIEMKEWRFGPYSGGILLALTVAFCSPLPAAGNPSGQGAPDTAKAVAAGQGLREKVGEADPYLRLGHARLKAGDLNAAEKAFKKALSAGDKKQVAEAYNGLGLVYAARPAQLQASIYYFQQALHFRPRYVEAQYNKAQTYFDHKWLPQAVQEVERAVRMDSTYVPARQLLERCRVRRAEEERRSQEAIGRALRSEPGDSSGWMAWGRDALAEKAYLPILRRLPSLVEAHPGWKGLLPILAQAYWRQGLIQQAWGAFEGYVEGLDGREREFYRDIRLICSRDMADSYNRASEEGRKVLARRFWTENDPDLTTPANERLLEHCRRVWYARTYFSKGKYPCDRRGEVYIRYGEPDYRSRSNGQTPPPTAAVNAVKEQFYNQIYSEMHAVLAMGGGSQIRTTTGPEEQGTIIGTQWFDAVTGALTGSIVGPVFPVRSYSPDAVGGVYVPIGSSDFSLVAWESWVYADIDGGIVIDFTDETNRGAFDYAPIPELDKTPGLRNQTLDGIKALATLARRSPKSVMERAVAVMPERYKVLPEEWPLGFHYDVATFRGKGDSTRVEVYYGVPMAKATYFPADARTGLRVACKVALAGKGAGAVYRSESDLIYVEEGDRTGRAGFIPHIAHLDIPPGEYRLDVRVEHRLNGEVGRYRKLLSVEPYPAGPLKLSDVQLAWKISEGGMGDKFFKQGLQVVPMPTRHYKKGQPVYIYYEIYNLKRDKSGRVNYTVEYTIRSGKPPGLVSQIARSFQGKQEGEGVSVSQERLGLRETEAQHLQLDLGQVAPGKVALTVTVKDLIGGQVASKEAAFVVEE